MKFSWIVVLGLAALAAALGTIVMDYKADAEMREGSMLSSREQLEAMSDREKELVDKLAALSGEIQEEQAKARGLEKELAQERKTHAPLRQQIARMNAESDRTGARSEGLQKKVDALTAKLGDVELELAAAERKLSAELSKQKEYQLLELRIAELSKKALADKVASASKIKTLSAMLESQKERVKELTAGIARLKDDLKQAKLKVAAPPPPAAPVVSNVPKEGTVPATP